MFQNRTNSRVDPEQVSEEVDNVTHPAGGRTQAGMSSCSRGMRSTTRHAKRNPLEIGPSDDTNCQECRAFRRISSFCSCVIRYNVPATPPRCPPSDNKAQSNWQSRFPGLSCLQAHFPDLPCYRSLGNHRFPNTQVRHRLSAECMPCNSPLSRTARLLQCGSALQLAGAPTWADDNPCPPVSPRHEGPSDSDRPSALRRRRAE